MRNILIYLVFLYVLVPKIQIYLVFLYVFLPKILINLVFLYVRVLKILIGGMTTFPSWYQFLPVFLGDLQLIQHGGRMRCAINSISSVSAILDTHPR